jgi:hypothetical protein
MRKSDLFLFSISVQLLLLILVFTHASFGRKAGLESISEKRKMVASLDLTDLCLFTDASYTRHLSQSDLNTPFQDSPLSLEHFPSGSLVPPPERLRTLNGKME